MVQVYISRHAPNVTARHIHFQEGEVIGYRLLDGTSVDATVKSDFMHHKQAKHGGYEVIFHDTGELGFADVDRIVRWSMSGAK